MGSRDRLPVICQGLLTLLRRFLMPAITRLGTGVQGFPVTYSVDGEQFVAVTTGTQGGSPVQKPRTMLQEVHRSDTGPAVYVFALPKKR